MFDPYVFSTGVRKLYNWRFTSDIAEQFIPRLERAKFLARHASGRDSVYIVRYSSEERDDNSVKLSDVLNKILDEFEIFPPLITDLLSYNKSRDELADILIRFLVSLDAHAPTAMTEEIRKLQLGIDEETALDALEEGGRPLSSNDRYMAARFVQHLRGSRPEFVPDLARLASVGLLTEVVEDFVKPVQRSDNSDLTIILDAPIALDYLGCSGKAPREDTKCIIEALQGIGCKIIALPITCEEMQRNLRAMLTKNPSERHGYTHSAIVKREVLLEFVQAVANDPEKALKAAGVTVRPLSLAELPNQHKYFPDERFEDFLAAISWVTDIAPREHDAMCLALTMRLRAGQHSSDLFRCRYVFVTRNARFVRDARTYCLDSRLITKIQESPVIHQRELATQAWLRTGLGASESVPLTHLLATCDRVLSLRNEVREAVGQKIRALTPEKIEQYELLLLDQKSIRRLADLTLNDETVITDANAEDLLEAMRRATAEEIRVEQEKKLDELKASTAEKLKSAQATAREAQAAADQAERERDAVVSQLANIQADTIGSIKSLAIRTNSDCEKIDRFGLLFVILVALIAGSNYLTGWLAPYPRVSGVLALCLAMFGAYHALMNALERPKVGIPTIVSWTARKLFARRLIRAGLDQVLDTEKLRVEKGQIDLESLSLK